MKVSACVTSNGVSYHIESDSLDEVINTLDRLSKDKATPAAAPAPVAKEEKPAAVAKGKPETAAKKPEQATAAPTPAAAPAAGPTEYSKTKIPTKITGFLGDKEQDPTGYADRRAELVKLLATFNVKNGPSLPADQWAPFEADLDKLIASETEDDLG